MFNWFYEFFQKYTQHSVEKQEILSHQKNILSIQLFTDFFDKNVPFTKFLLKCVRVNLHNTVWKNERFTVTHKKFRQINPLVFSVVKTLLSRNFCKKCVRLNCINFHTVTLCNVIPKIRCLMQKFREINMYTSYIYVL